MQGCGLARDPFLTHALITYMRGFHGHDGQIRSLVSTLSRSVGICSPLRSVSPVASASFADTLSAPDLPDGGAALPGLRGEVAWFGVGLPSLKARDEERAASARVFAGDVAAILACRSRRGAFIRRLLFQDAKDAAGSAACRKPPTIWTGAPAIRLPSAIGRRPDSDDGRDVCAVL